MRRVVGFLAILICLLFAVSAVEAQFSTPSINGTISTNEYGVHTNGQNQQSTGSGQTWYMTWDDTNLYVAVTTAALSEGAVIYIDRNPLSPPNGGTNADGNTSGFNYDNTNFSSLPFRADFVAYFKDGYREYRTATGGGIWSSQTSGFGSYASGAGNIRELAIPWSAITGGGRPASFLFFSYVTNGGGSVYGQVPQGNASGNIGTSVTYNRYYAVVNTNNGSATKPFSLDQSVSSDNIQYLGLKHDTFDSYYRSPFGAVTTGSSVNLKFRTDLLDVSSVFLKVYQYNPATGTNVGSFVEYPMTYLENRAENGTIYSIYSVNYTAPATPSIIYYKFRIVDGAAQAFYSDAYSNLHDNLGQGGDGAASSGEPDPAFQLTVYASNFTTPAWLQNASVYQIFPDRFRNGDITNDWCRQNNTTGCPSLYGGSPMSNIIQTVWNTQMQDPRATGNNNAYSAQFYGGDLKGIQDKLDYIRNLGFDTLYLNPIFKARSNHRYDADDYLAIAPELGGDAAFQNLVTAANARGMRIILDGVWNHMSQDSEYFDYYHRIAGDNGACESLSSPYRTWFKFHSNATAVPCNYTDYDGWFGFGSLPEFEENDQVKNFFYKGTTDNVTKHWYDRGASGWRFDVVPDISHQWWNDYRGYAKTYKSDGPLIGEVFEDASSYLAGDQLDSVMNYRFRKNVLGFARNMDWSDDDNNDGNGNKIIGLTPSQFNRAMMAIREDYPLPAQRAMLNLIDSHDTNRALFILQNDFESSQEAVSRMKLAAIFQFTYIGTPMVYYGDEAAINAPAVNTNNSNAALADDPYNRAPYPWADEGGNQTIYGPVNTDLVSFYTKLGSLRRGYSSLRTGDYATLLTGDTTVSVTDNNTFAFIRTDANNKVVVVMNNGTTMNTATIPVGAHYADGTILTDQLGNSSFAPDAMHTVSNGTITVTLPARTGAILSNNAATGANASVSGRVLNFKKFGIEKISVILTDNQGNTRRATTDASGAYSFDELESGVTYIVSVNSKRYRFIRPTRIISVNEDVTDVNFSTISYSTSIR